VTGLPGRLNSASDSIGDETTSRDLRIGVGLLIATSFFIVVFFFDCMWSAGIDLADHNAVVNRLFDHWGIVSSSASLKVPSRRCGSVAAASPGVASAVLYDP
jgi:hypothetical protein